MAKYKDFVNCVQRLSDGACIPKIDGNRDWEEYKTFDTTETLPADIVVPMPKDQKMDLEISSSTLLPSLLQELADRFGVPKVALFASIKSKVKP